jgi:hypothetical protein
VIVMRPFIALVVSLAAAPMAFAQDTRSVAPVDAALVRGAPVRVEVAGRSRVAGTLVRVDDDSLLVGDGARVIAVPRAQVSGVSVKAGGRSRGAGAARGAVIGIGIGAILGGIAGYSSWEPCEAAEFFCSTETRSRATVGAATAVGFLGAAIGALSGAVVGRQRWRPVPLPPGTQVGFLVTPSRVGVTLRI